jgi:hypothetical protein
LWPRPDSDRGHALLSDSAAYFWVYESAATVKPSMASTQKAQANPHRTYCDSIHVGPATGTGLAPIDRKAMSAEARMVQEMAVIAQNSPMSQARCGWVWIDPLPNTPICRASRHAQEPRPSPSSHSGEVCGRTSCTPGRMRLFPRLSLRSARAVIFLSRGSKYDTEWLINQE